MDSQPSSSLLLPEEEQRQLRVVYAADDQQRSERIDGRETRRTGRPSDAGEAGDLARRGRRRKFITRHHLESGAGEPAQGVAHVREEIDRALQTFRGMEAGGQSTSHGGGVEVQGLERFVDEMGVIGVRGTPVTGPSGEMPQASQGPVTVGTGPHALVLDAGMIDMVNKSAAGRRHRYTGANAGKGRGGRDRRGGGKRQPVRRREGLAALGGPQQSKLRRTVHTPLSSRILAQEDTHVESGTPNKSLDAFVSQLQAPSPDQAPVRVRMRAPTSLAEQANTLGPRLHFDASNARGVSTLRVRVIRAERENGKFKCLCHCEHPMGVFEGHLVLMVTNQIVGLEEVREGAGLILNKPWLVLGGLEVEETKIPALFPLHPVTWAGAECA